jgi:hypothetical protein
MARPDPTPDESLSVASATHEILEGLGEVDRTILRMKLAGASDGEVATAVSMSRPTVAGRKKAVLQRIEDATRSLDEPLEVVLLDEVQRELSHG